MPVLILWFREDDMISLLRLEWGIWLHITAIFTWARVLGWIYAPYFLWFPGKRTHLNPKLPPTSPLYKVQKRAFRAINHNAKQRSIIAEFQRKTRLGYCGPWILDRIASRAVKPALCATLSQCPTSIRRPSADRPSRRRPYYLPNC